MLLAGDHPNLKTSESRFALDQAGRVVVTAVPREGRADPRFSGRDDPLPVMPYDEALMPDAPSSDRRVEVTSLIGRMSNGDHQAGAELYDLLRIELRSIAEAHFQVVNDKAHTLQPTALVHEAWIRMIGASGGIRDRTHFLATSSRAMRSILVDHARRKQCVKRGGDYRRVSLDSSVAARKEKDIDLVVLDEALKRLAERDERRARVVELRFFGGLTVDETADVLSRSAATVRRDWRLARLWLLNDLSLP